MPVKTKATRLDMVAICQALGDPIRFSIVRTLEREGPTACGGFGLDLPGATLTHHFNVLRKAGVITTDVAGTRRINVLNRRAIDAQFPGFLDSLLGTRSAR
jgi:predicted transcriptional regulator